MYVYKVNNQFELKFIIPKSTGKVNHISVFSPEDSINKMAGVIKEDVTKVKIDDYVTSFLFYYQ
ncbi:hypothetical protein AAHB49_17270 [Bacillus cereus]